MALDQYKQKRHFERTPEPTGGKSRASKLIFVVQKHAASHLHYDFRLEMRGVLKSWAVPKGPSMNPDDHRLAQAVEDHPFDYRDFEGIIPKGQYGGGTVMVWDTGTYEPLEKTKGKSSQEHILLSGYYKGALSIQLHGTKLKGIFTLVRTPGRGENAWLLTKAKDTHALKRDITLKDRSVISGKTIDEIASSADAAVWNSNRSERSKSSIGIKQKGKKSKIPTHVSPMLCTLTQEPVTDNAFIHEIKWDGYRIVAFNNKGKVHLYSRSALDYTGKYPPVAAALKSLNCDVVLDGEVVVFNSEGKPDFDALQKYNGHNTPINYCVFDVIWLNGYDLTMLPLTERKEILKQLVDGNEVFKYSESFDNGAGLYEQCIKLELEGIVSKKKNSVYQPGARGNDWLKTPTRIRQEFVIGGWAESDKARSFRSLLFGAYNNGKFEWIGRSGGGYKEKEMPAILTQLKKLETDKSPFVNKILDAKGATIHWVKPQLVANFEFATWTKSGRIRKPATFLGFRKDKKATEVVREVPLSPAAEEKIEQLAHDEDVSAIKISNWPKILNKKITSQQEFEIAEQTVTLNNVELQVWSDVSKADLITYYHKIARFILPHLQKRPLSLHIKDNNPVAPGFYIKDMEGHQPAYVDVFKDKRRIPKKGKRNVIEYGVCNNEAALLYFVNIGCIDFNPWSSTVDHPDEPDYISIDLDPTVEDFKKVIATANAVKNILDKLKLKSVVKTSGKTGIHIFIPCQGFNNAEVKKLGKIIYDQTHELVPDITTDLFSKSQRNSRVFVDYTLNDYADTLACVYSVRPNHMPTVSTPLRWKEVNEKLHPSQFTIHNILQRVEKQGDLFKEVLNEKVKAANTLKLKKMLQ